MTCVSGIWKVSKKECCFDVKEIPTKPMKDEILFGIHGSNRTRITEPEAAANWSDVVIRKTRHSRVAKVTHMLSDVYRSTLTSATSG